MTRARKKKARARRRPEESPPERRAPKQRAPKQRAPDETAPEETAIQEQDPGSLPADDLLPVLEALLFAAHEPLSPRRLAQALRGVAVARVREGLEEFRKSLEQRRAPLQLIEIAGGHRLVTRPEYAPYLARLLHRAEKERLSAAALETLAIVAYRQPATRADIEAIRGVQAGPVLRALQERRLVKVVGRAPVVGRPQQFGTTRKFLDLFGLASLKDLPSVLAPDLAGALEPPGAGEPGAADEAPEAAGSAGTEGSERESGTETDSPAGPQDPPEGETPREEAEDGDSPGS
jgi:segregation and condensation protein B